MKIKSLLTLLLAICLISCNDNSQSDRLPSILFLSVDDMAYNSIGVFGCTVEDITPNIDKLASEGMKFTNAHVNTPVCQPCRQSWLTGMFPHSNDAEGFEPIDESVKTLPELLKGLGYVNGILGKEIHHQPREKFFWDFIPHVTDPDSTWRKASCRNPVLFYEYSREFFEMAKNQDKPFFFSANSHDPHRPFIGNDTAAWGADNMPPVSRQYTPEEIDVLGYLPDIPDVRKEVAQYYGNVYRADQNVGAVLRALKESGLEENTVIFFMSDHGAAFPFSKAQCYLNSSKTPLIVKWPENIKPGTVDEEHMIMTIDLMPTVMEIVGLPELAEIQGTSFLPVLKEKVQQDREYAYSSFYQIFARIRYPMRCVQNENFGYIYNFWSDGQQQIRGDATSGLTWKAMNEAAKTDPEIAKRVDLYRYRVPEEFYDVKNDPDALVNLINDPEYADEIEKFRSKMLEMMEKYDDPAYEAFKNRNNPDVIPEFMEAQRAKAKRTKPVKRF